MSIMRCDSCEEQFDTDHVELHCPADSGIESKLDNVCEDCLFEMEEEQEESPVVRDFVENQVEEAMGG